ncbi:MAG: metallophosphoesterase [Sinobacteraceae bacterium]|nr:metallophosphoesterase [Nevskiaceae bacterium]
MNSARRRESGQLIRHLTGNFAGRDFVVGDLHGHRRQFDELLARCGFDAGRDRVFSVGDLIDRGPDSPACLSLLREPWFHAVRGNHEQMLLDAYEGDDEAAAIWFNNGGRWARDANEANLDRWASKIRALPLVISVAEGAGRFNILHAETCRTDEELDCGDLSAHQVERLLWGRSLVGGGGSRFSNVELTAAGLRQPRLSTTYVGHTPVLAVRRIGSHVFVDTGAGKPRGFLTLLEPATGRTWDGRRDFGEEGALQWE